MIDSQEVDADKDFEITVDLDEGRRDLMLQEVDEFGNASEKVDLATLYVDTTEPEVTIEEPTKNKTDDLSVLFRATVEDSVTEAEDLFVQLSVTGANEKTLHVSAINEVTDMVPLREGQNQITIYVEDEAGNFTVKTTTIKRTVPEAANWALYALFAAIIAIILAAIAVLRRSV